MSWFLRCTPVTPSETQANRCGTGFAEYGAMLSRAAVTLHALSSLVLALVGFASNAAAESAAVQCDFSDRVLPRVTQLPANAPAIVVLPPRFLPARDAGDFAFQVTTPAMTPLTTTTDTDASGAYLLRPAAPLTEGHHTVRYQNVCAYWQQSNTTKEEKVNVGPAVDLPTVVGTAANAKFETFNACYPMRGNVLVSVILTPEMKAYREIAQFTATFKGERAFAPYGDYNTITTGNGFFSFTAACEKDQASITGELVVSAHVAGAPADPTALRTTLQIPCPYYGINDPNKIPVCPPPPDAAMINLDAGVGAEPLNNLDASSGSVTREDDGCSYGGGRGRSHGLAALLMVMAIAVQRHRVLRAGRRRARSWRKGEDAPKAPRSASDFVGR